MKKSILLMLFTLIIAISLVSLFSCNTMTEDSQKLPYFTDIDSGSSNNSGSKPSSPNSTDGNTSTDGNNDVNTDSSIDIDSDIMNDSDSDTDIDIDIDIDTDSDSPVKQNIIIVDICGRISRSGTESGRQRNKNLVFKISKDNIKQLFNPIKIHDSDLDNSFFQIL